MGRGGGSSGGVVICMILKLGVSSSQLQLDVTAGP